MESGTRGRRVDTLLLLGLPASGKSVIRRQLSKMAHRAEGSVVDVGPMVQLDDFPYVHLMRSVDHALAELGHGHAFYDRDLEQFLDLRDFMTLIYLLDEDCTALEGATNASIEAAGRWIIERLSRARALAGLETLAHRLGPEAVTALSRVIESETAIFATEWCERRRPPGATVVIEFARGGPEGATPPLAPPFGYAHALPCLSPSLLTRATVLYAWVTPDQSRARNRMRATQGAQGSTFGHAVPERVMRECYGTDDMDWLMATSDEPGTVRVEAHGTTFRLPVIHVDNREEPRDGTGDELAQHLDHVLARAFSDWQERIARSH